jgi:hypothetical protein
MPHGNSVFSFCQCGRLTVQTTDRPLRSPESAGLALWRFHWSLGRSEVRQCESEVREVFHGREREPVTVPREDWEGVVDREAVAAVMGS